MPTVEKTHGGLVLVRSIGERFKVGDRADVDEETARYLTDERGDFALVDGEEMETDESDADSENDEFDVDRFLDRTPVEDVADDIHAGEADDHLDAVADAADRTTVHDAIGERRAELEG